MSFLTEPITLFPNSSRRIIEGIAVNVTITESTSDVLTITKQPVQQGASITDHAFKEPTTLSMTVQDKADLTTSLKELYKNFIDLQNSRTPFSIVTPKRIYENMLMASLSQTTDKNTENILALNLVFQQIIIVKVSTTQVPRRAQKNPGATAKTENAGKKSALFSSNEGIGSPITPFRGVR